MCSTFAFGLAVSFLSCFLHAQQEACPLPPINAYAHAIFPFPIRWQKISKAMGGRRTPRQVASRVQKYFEKLKKFGVGI